MTKFVNRCKVGVALAPGTGNATLGTAAAGFQTPVEAGVKNNDLVSYALIDGVNWEIGYGTYNLAGNYITRNNVIQSTNSNNPIDASILAKIVLTPLAQDLNKPLIRQAVISGQTNTSGKANIFPSTSSDLTLSTTGVNTNYPLILSCAKGYGETGPVDLNLLLRFNKSWTLTPNGTFFLYIDVSTGNTGFTSLAPIYQWAGSADTTNGQYTFITSQMQGYMGNGVSADPSNIVFIGEATTDGSTVINTLIYNYRGRYDSGWISTLPASATPVTFSANLGTNDTKIDFYIRCDVTEANYSVGDILTASSGLFSKYTFWRNDRNTVGYINSGGVSVLDKTTGGETVLTAAKWSYRVVVTRNW